MGKLRQRCPIQLQDPLRTAESIKTEAWQGRKGETPRNPGPITAFHAHQEPFVSSAGRGSCAGKGWDTSACVGWRNQRHRPAGAGAGARIPPSGIPRRAWWVSARSQLRFASSVGWALHGCSGWRWCCQHVLASVERALARASKRNQCSDKGKVLRARLPSQHRFQQLPPPCLSPAPSGHLSVPRRHGEPWVPSALGSCPAQTELSR